MVLVLVLLLLPSLGIHVLVMSSPGAKISTSEPLISHQPSAHLHSPGEHKP